MSDELLKQKKWLEGKKLLPFVYSIDGKITITEKLIDVLPINAIRGLMISDTIELEIACSCCDFLTAKMKALEAKAELLCYGEAELYENSYSLFCNTVFWLDKNGFKLDKLSYSALINLRDGEWCEEVYHEPAYSRYEVCHHVVKSVNTAVSVSKRRYCRLLYRHEVTK